MAYHLYDDDDNYLGPGPFSRPKRRRRERLSLYDEPYERPRARSYAEALPESMLQGPQPASPGPLLSQPTEGAAPDRSAFGLPMNRFATIAGLAAQAIAPDSFGGRLGGAAAGLAVRDEDYARRLELAREQERQRLLRGELSRKGRAIAPGYTIPPENRDPNQPYTGPLLPSQRTRAINPGQEVVGETPDGAYGPLYRSERTPAQLAPPPTALGASRPAYGDYPAVEGEFSPREQQLRPLPPPPATPLGSSRPGYGQFPAVEGRFSPRQSLVPINPGQEVIGSSEEGTLGPLYRSERTPAQLAPPATPVGSSRPAYAGQPEVVGEFSPRAQQLRPPPATARTQSRPAYTDPATGGAYPAVGPLFTPREQAVIGAPGSTIIPAPGQAPIVAQPTARQSTVPLGPGASAFRGGKIVATAPTTPAQRAKGAAGAKPGKPTMFDKQVDTFTAKFKGLKDIPPKPGMLWGEYPGRSAKEQAQEEIANETGTRKSAMEAAYLRVFEPELLEGGAQQTTQPSTPVKGSTPAKSNSLKGQRTSRPDGTYRMNGKTYTVRGGVIQ